MNLNQLQEEVGEWSLRNFGEQPYWRRMLGITEELGEFADAETTVDELDAIADVVIYAADLCSVRGWDLGLITDSAEQYDSFDPPNPVSPAGRLSHALLKQEQKIRGTWEDHEVSAKTAMGELVTAMRAHCGWYNKSLNEVVGEVWSKVKERDWKANPTSAHRD